jgi:Tfp pilus assembly protein PilX
MPSKCINHRQSARPGRPRQRRGAALLMCLSIIFIVTLLVVHVYDTITIELTSVHNNIDYERALYLANAGVHAVAAQLEQDPSWRGTLTDGAYPGDDTYSATAVSAANGTAVVTSKGVSHAVTRTITATFQL